MPKKKIDVDFYSYGIYDGGVSATKSIPKIKKFTTAIPAVLDIEFGMVVKISSAKGKRLDYCIDHPPFKDKRGNVEPSFTGSVFIKNNSYDFYIGDTIWEPIDDKCGTWTLSCSIDGKQIAKKSFTIELSQ